MTPEERQALVDGLAALILGRPTPYLIDARGGVITPAIPATIHRPDFGKRPARRRSTPAQVLSFPPNRRP